MLLTFVQFCAILATFGSLFTAVLFDNFRSTREWSKVFSFFGETQPQKRRNMFVVKLLHVTQKAETGVIQG